MMWLSMIAFSLLILLCDLFSTTTSNNLIPSYDVTSMNNDDPSSSCIFGVKSVSIVLYTSDNPESKFVQINESCNLFDSSKPVFFMTHGFLSNSRNYNFSQFASRMLKRNYTVFSLDWSDAACYNDLAVVNLLAYPFAVHNTHEVGDYLANYVKSVIDTCHVPMKNITLMGHSLGAHISGFAAKNLQKSGYGKIPLLIGIDSAAPLFGSKSCKDRFCKKDAKRVVALHTSALGLQKSLGHLDLWFNNGLNQPKCGGKVIGSLNVKCSHNIAITYLANTLKDDCAFMGNSISPRISIFDSIEPGCSSDKINCVVVDNRLFDPSYSLEGNYCVSVSSEYPYCTKDNFSCLK